MVAVCENRMMIKLDDNLRRALGLAVQILEDVPEHLQPASNMNDMRAMLEGRSSGRDGLIVAEAIAIALAWRTLMIADNPPSRENSEVYSRRMEEFRALFEALRSVDVWRVATSYNEICDRLARSRQ